MIIWVLDKIKKHNRHWKIDHTKILVDMDNNLSDDTTLKNIVMLITFIIKNADKFYSQIFLEETLVA